MTITAQTAKSGPYNGNGSTTVFSYAFKVADEADLVVTVLSADGGTETVKTLTTDYTVSGVGNAGGGSITMLVAPVTGEKLTITRSVDLDQEVDLQNRGSVNPQTLEDSLDKLTQIAQDQQQQLDRSLKVDLFETADLATLTTNVNAVAAIATEVGTVAGISSDVTAVAADATDIGTVAGSIADVSTVAGISANVTSVAGISANVTTVAGISADVTAVAGDAADIGTVAGISANVTTVAGISANVTTVAGISSDVTAVAADAADIGTVAGISTEIGTVAGISANVSTVAGDSADIQTLAPISADIQALTVGTGGALTGDWTASGVWEFTASSYLGIPRGTTAERGSPGAGIAAFRYNEDDATFEGWNGTAWGEFGGSVDFSAVAADIIPDADSTRDIGSTSTRWAQGWFDDVTSTNTSDGSLTIPTTYVTNGSAKAWVNFNGTGTIAARDSLNLSSLTDNGTGNYLITVTSAFGAADFNSTAGTGLSGLTTSDFIMPWNATPTASTINITTWNGGQVSLLDSEFISVSLMGDLA